MDFPLMIRLDYISIKAPRHLLLSRIQFVAPEGEAPPLRHAAHPAAAAAPSIAAAGGVAGLLDVNEAFAVCEPP